MKTIAYIRANTQTYLSSRLSPILFIVIVIQLALMVSITSAYAAQVTLGWDQTTEADLAGYKIYYGAASRNYTQSFDVSDRTSTSCTITDLIEGQTYYFAATAYSTSLVESPYSAEVSYTVPPATTELASFDAIPGYKEVTLFWETGREIDNDGFNLYRAEAEDGEYIKINESLIPAEGSVTQGTSYEFVDTDLKNRQTYYYKLEDIDRNGNSTMHGPVSATPRWIYGIFRK